jgi:glycosyltransferase involved in cell wall biosynthesis
MKEPGTGLVIGHVVLSLDVGGLERVVATLARAQREAGARVSVYCLDRAGALAGPLPAAGVPVHTVGRGGRGFDVGAMLRLARMLRADGVRVVHCHNHGALVSGALAARLVPGTRVVYTVHGAITSARRSTSRFLRLGLVHDVVFVSAHARNVGRQAGLATDDHVHTIVNGVDLTAFTSGKGDGRRIRHEHGIPDHAPVCGIVARLTEAKDHRTLFAAMVIARETYPALHCLVVGDGELRDELERDAAARGLSGVVHFTGARDNIRDYLDAMDVFVLSSVTEGLAMTLLEAMAAARPVVATRVGGNPEVVEDGVTGRLVAPSDPSALAGAIVSVLNQPDAARAMGDAGRVRAGRRFGLDAMVRQYQAVYEATAAEAFDKQT